MKTVNELDRIERILNKLEEDRQKALKNGFKEVASLFEELIIQRRMEYLKTSFKSEITM